VTVEQLVAKMRKARSGSTLLAHMKGLGFGVSWKKEGGDADTYWVYEQTRSCREAEELATMLLSHPKDYSDVCLRPPDWRI